jgi:hypothetical protein
MQALAELIAEGVVEAKGVKFQKGKWRTIWCIKHGPRAIRKGGG